MFPSIRNLFLLFFVFISIHCGRNADKDFSSLRKKHTDAKEILISVQNREVRFVSSSCHKNQTNVLVFVHGSPGTWQDYRYYLEEESLRENYCILALDRPGFGKSGSESLPDLAAQSEILSKALLQYLSDNYPDVKMKMVLVGHSYGGPIVFRTSLNWQDKMNCLILLSAPMDPQLEEVRWYNKFASYSLVQFFLPKEIINSNDEMLPLKWQLEELDSGWKNISYPIIQIHGKEDSLVPLENTNYLKRKMNPSLLTTIELENENHFIPWTQKEFIKNIILKVNRK